MDSDVKVSNTVTPKEYVTHMYIDTRVAGINNQTAVAYATRIAPIVVDQAMKAQAQTHVVDAEESLLPSASTEVAQVKRSQPIPIPQRSSSSMVASSYPQKRYIQVPSNKHSYIVGKHSRHSSYTFGPGKLNNLTLTGVKGQKFQLDAAISGVDVLNCSDIVIDVSRPTFCNVELSSNIVISGPAVVDSFKSLDVSLNGKTLPYTVSRNLVRRQVDVKGFIREPITAKTETLPLPSE